MRGWRRSARATAATRRSVCVTFTPCDFSMIGISRCARRIERRRIHVACHEEMRHGRPALRRPLGHDAADRAHCLRRARRSRWPPSAATSRRAAFMMSSARISPPGPDPRSVAMSTPCSRARRRAFGEILAPAAETGSGAAGAAAAAAAAGAESILRPVCAARNVGRRLLAWLQEPRDRLADGNDVALFCGDAAKNPVALRFDLDHRLVGLDLEQHLALLDLISLLLLPRDQLARFLRHLERRHHHAMAISDVGSDFFFLTPSGLQPSPPRHHLRRPPDSAAPRSHARVGSVAADGDERRTGDEQLLSREPRDHFVSGCRDDDLFFDARGAPSRPWSARRSRARTPCLA